MGKVYLEKNVLDAAIERLEYVFDIADNVCFSVSGGKDSSVMVQLADMIATKKNKLFDCLFIDLEGQYKATIEHINELKKLKNIRCFFHVALPLYLRNAVSILQPKWVCWNPKEQDVWIRELPKDSINIKNHNFDFYTETCEFEEFVYDFNDWYQKKYGGLCFIGVGIRSDESLNRFRTIAFIKNKTMYNNWGWTTQLLDNKLLYNFYPLYDWATADIWGAVSKFNFSFNTIYELMYKNGLSIHQQRLCQPYGDDQRDGLDQFKALEYETWGKILNRVNGVNFGNIYARSSALGNLKSSKPKFMTWQEYTVYLLESIGIYNEGLKKHYYEKIVKFIAWYQKEEGINITDIPEEENKRDEAMKKKISWRRIARAIEKNDFYMSRLSFGQTKSDYEKLKNMIKKWEGLLSVDTQSTSKPLREVIKEVYG